MSNFSLFNNNLIKILTHENLQKIQIIMNFNILDINYEVICFFGIILKDSYEDIENIINNVFLKLHYVIFF